MTSKSPRKVLKLAHELARRVLPAYDNRFSRHDFTNAQLFACLVPRAARAPAQELPRRRGVVDRFAGVAGRHRLEGSWGEAVNRNRRRVVSRLPKLSLAYDCATHLILSATASTGAGGDQPYFDDLLYHAWRRCASVRCVVADAGYDLENNHRLARLDMRVRSIIPPRAGRPTSKPPLHPINRCDA